MPSDFDEVEFGSRRLVRGSAADALFGRARRPTEKAPSGDEPAEPAPREAPGPRSGSASGEGTGRGRDEKRDTTRAKKPRNRKQGNRKQGNRKQGDRKQRDRKQGDRKQRDKKRRRRNRRDIEAAAGPAAEPPEVSEPPDDEGSAAGVEQAPPPVPNDAVLVPLDQWTKVMNQLGNLHEAGQQIAEARERAARAETEVVFLRERLKEMRAEIEVERRRRAGEPAPVTPEPGRGESPGS